MRVVQVGKNSLNLLILLALGTLFILSSCSRSSTADMPIAPPGAPANVQLEVAKEGVQVSWDCIPGVTHYTVFWGTDRDHYRNLTNAETCSLTLAGLKKGRFYAFAVTAWNQQGESDYSREAAVVYDDDPGRAPEYVEKGNDLMERGLYTDAHLYFSAAIRLDPQNAGAYRRRGLLYERTNQSSLAREDYRRAERLLSQKQHAKQQASP